LPYEKGSELAAPCIFQIYTRDRNWEFIGVVFP
jgi:hypothetical protein